MISCVLHTWIISGRLLSFENILRCLHVSRSFFFASFVVAVVVFFKALSMPSISMAVPSHIFYLLLDINFCFFCFFLSLFRSFFVFFFFHYFSFIVFVAIVCEIATISILLTGCLVGISVYKWKSIYNLTEVLAWVTINWLFFFLSALFLFISFFAWFLFVFLNEFSMIFAFFASKIEWVAAKHQHIYTSGILAIYRICRLIIIIIEKKKKTDSTRCFWFFVSFVWLL